MENSDDQFSLKWNNFQSNLATGFHDLLQEEDMVDVTLAAEGKFLQAHKIILSVCSPYFKDLFKVNPCKHPIVILKDVGHQELSDMLDFMYRGEASVRQEDLAAFLKLAETLKVKGLAGDKPGEESSSQSQKKSGLLPKKKKIVEASVFEPDDDPGDPDFSPGGVEPKRKRKRVSSPAPKTDISTSATNSYVPLANPKEEVQDEDEAEFLDETTNDPLIQFISGKSAKQEVETSNEFDDTNLEMTGDDTHDGDMDMTAGMTAGPSNADAEQVPQEEEEDDGLVLVNGSSVEEKSNKFMVQTPIWDFFSKTTTETGDVRAVCHVCDKSLRFHNTSVMVRHLRFLHPKQYEEYRSDYIESRMGVGYDIRGGILGLPSTPPKRPRSKKTEHKFGKQKEVKKLLVLKERTEEEESNIMTEKELKQLVQGNIKVISISKRGTIPENMMLEGGRQSMLKDNLNAELSAGAEALEASEQYQVVHVGYMDERLSASQGGDHMTHTQLIQIPQHSELLEIWGSEGAEGEAVLVCSGGEDAEDSMEVVIAQS